MSESYSATKKRKEDIFERALKALEDTPFPYVLLNGSRAQVALANLRKVWDAEKAGRLCENDRCLEQVSGQARYCSDRCASAARQRRFKKHHREALRG